MALEQAFARHGEHVIVMNAVDSYRVRRTRSRRGGRNKYSEPLVARACREIIVVQCGTAASPLALRVPRGLLDHWGRASIDQKMRTGAKVENPSTTVDAY